MLVEFNNKVKRTNAIAPEVEKIPEMPELKEVPPVPAAAPVVAEMQKPAEPQKPKAKTAANLFARIKKVKNFEIYLAVGLILIMIAIYLTTFGGSGSSSNKTSSTATEDYAREIETKLVKTLSQIKGAGKVEAMVTVVSTATIEIAYNYDEKTVTQGGNGSTTTTTTITKTPVIINGKEALILYEVKPQIKGVVVVAGGANDVGVKLQLLRAVQTVIADDSARIEIFAGQ